MVFMISNAICGLSRGRSRDWRRL